MSGRKKWTRLEGHHRSRGLSESLKARIADPLWTLGRQWQFGEFKGDDAASPIKVCLKHNSLNVSHLTLYDDNNQIEKRYAVQEHDLLEPIAERGFITKENIVDTRVSAEAALQFIRHLPLTSRSPALAALRYMFPLTNDVNTSAAAMMTLLTKKSFDARRLRKISDEKLRNLATQLSIPLSELDTAFKRWSTYYDARFSEPQKNNETWQKDRLEYRFGVNATTQGTTAKVALQAKEYKGGQLDWHQFDLDAGNSQRLKNALPNPEENWLIPTPVRYAGMPADRYWNCEDGKVFFGGLDAEKTDLSRLLLSEFATVYSNDWYVLPLAVKTGHVTRVHSIQV